MVLVVGAGLLTGMFLSLTDHARGLLGVPVMYRVGAECRTRMNGDDRGRIQRAMELGIVLTSVLAPVGGWTAPAGDDAVDIGQQPPQAAA